MASFYGSYRNSRAKGKDYRSGIEQLHITILYPHKKYYKSMPTPIKYTEVKVIKLTKIQSNTLKKLGKYNIRVCDFIRDAINEKLKRDKHEIIKPKEIKPPF